MPTDPQTIATVPESAVQLPVDPEVAFDREALESKIEDQLTAVFSDGTPEDEAAEEVVETEDKKDDAAETEEETTTEEVADDDATQEVVKKDDEVETEETEDETGEEAATAEAAPTLPDAYRRSLKAYGWQDDEIDQNLEALGDKFVTTAERIHGNRNTEMAKWAEAGRQVRTPSKDQGTNPDQPEKGASNQPTRFPETIAPVDAAKLKERYGEDEMLDEIVKPVNAAIAAINAVLPGIQQVQQQSQQAEVTRVAADVEKYFAQDALAPYQSLYGKADEGFSEEQLGHRNQLLDTAFNLIAGSEQLRGEAMPLHEAMDFAHEIVAKDFKVTQVQAKVVKTAKTRNRSISQRPSRRGVVDTMTGQPKDRGDLEARTEARLAKIFSK